MLDGTKKSPASVPGRPGRWYHRQAVRVRKLAWRAEPALCPLLAQQGPRVSCQRPVIEIAHQGGQQE
jgi:hypothetical protein